MKKLPAPRTDRISYVKHRQDVMRQIMLPMIVVAVIVIAFAVLVLVSTFFQAGDVSRWASVAIIWMVIPLMTLLLVILAASLGVVYLLQRLVQVSPRYTGMVQAYVLLINEQIILWTNRIIQPILKAKAWLSLFSKEE